MNLHRGFLRLTILASLIVGLVVALVSEKPSYEEFRWRKPTVEEKQKAEHWQASGAKQFDPDMFLMLGDDGKVLKERQKLLPFQYSTDYFILPFLYSCAVIWLFYFFIRYLVLGYVVRGFKSGKA